VTVSTDSITLDLAPLVAVPGATLRFASGTATLSIEPCFWFFGNIQDQNLRRAQSSRGPREKYLPQ
ncbi:MAG TPA: hypothetical protein VMG59_12480, partial [Phycisphaerae bacterium]|nr:hypothetical protein [Phycisphaerae bacterium]